MNSANLQIVNQGTGTALDLRVGPGEPPLRVNRSRLVPKLNADRVDGMDANALIRAAHAETLDVDEAVFSGDNPSSANIVTASITAPSSGLLIMSGSVDSHGSVEDPFLCYLVVDGSSVVGSERGSLVSWVLSNNHTNNSQENCGTDGVREVSPGAHTFSLQIGSRSTVKFSDASVWAIFVPFDGTGQRITVP